MDLTKIKGPSFLKELTEKELNDLAKDIRQFIIESVSQTGGHLSSNLGITTVQIIPKTAMKVQQTTAFQITAECKISALATMMLAKKEERATRMIIRI